MLCAKSNTLIGTVLLVVFTAVWPVHSFARLTDGGVTSNVSCGLVSTTLNPKGAELLSAALKSNDQLCTSDPPASTPDLETGFLSEVRECATSTMEEISPSISKSEIDKSKKELHDLRILMAIAQSELHINNFSADSFPSKARIEVVIPNDLRPRFSKLPKQEDLRPEEINDAIIGMSVDTAPLIAEIRTLIDTQGPELLKNGMNPMSALSSQIGARKDEIENKIRASAAAQINKMLEDNPRLLYATESTPSNQGISRAQQSYVTAVKTEAQAVKNLQLDPPETAALGLLSYSPCVVKALKGNPNFCSSYASLTDK